MNYCRVLLSARVRARGVNFLEIKQGRTLNYELKALRGNLILEDPRCYLRCPGIAFGCLSQGALPPHYSDLVSRVLKASSDSATTSLLANPFHSGILTKNEFLYTSLPLFGGIWKDLLLFVMYCSTMLCDTQ